MKARHFTSFLLAGFAVGFIPHISYAEPMEQVLAKLIHTNPQISAADKTLESSRVGIDIAKSGFYPIVTANAEIGPEVIDSPGTRGTGTGEHWSRTKQIASLTVTQNLFNGFQTRSQVRQARLNREIASISLEGTRQNSLFEGINTYINVLRNKRLVELAQEKEATILKQLNLEDERVQRGSGVTVDVLQAKSRLQLAKERRVSLEGGLEDAISRYAQVFNRPPNIETMMDPMPPVELIPSTLERTVAIASAENPGATNAGASIEVARERRNAISGERLPTFDLEGNWNFEKHNSSTIGVRRDYSLLLKASWDLFTGFTTSNTQAQATFDYAATQDVREFALRKIVEQTRLAWQTLLTSRKRIELLENAVNIAAEVFDARKKLHAAGEGTIINVLDAENEVNNAQINFTSASYDERISVYQLLMSMGRLTPASLKLNS